MDGNVKKTDDDACDALRYFIFNFKIKNEVAEMKKQKKREERKRKHRKEKSRY